MSSFTTPLVVSPMPSGRKWKLVREFTYHLGSKYGREYIYIPPGFVTDFASFFLWRLLFWWLPYWAKYNKAAPIHDRLYQVKRVMVRPITRKEADNIFREAMLVDWKQHKSGPALASLEYWAVRLFGWLAWNE